MHHVDVVGLAARIALAIAFANFGWQKVFGTEWDGLFADIGAGRWLQSATGMAQMAGALALVVPRTARLGAMLIGLTMAGAIAMHLFVLPTGLGGAVIPAAFLAFAARAARRSRPVEDTRLSLR